MTGATLAYGYLYEGVLIFLGIALLFCLIRAIRGPRMADRIISVNMMGTLVVLIICILAFLMQEDYLVDIALVYTMLSFLAVVILTRICMGVWRSHHREKHEGKEC